MAFNNRGFLAALLLAVAAAELVGNAAAATYVVGDTLGWRVPNNPSDYSNWASRHIFRVGDVLVFNFMTNLHDVAQVTKAAYDGCSSATPILLVMTGPWNVTLNSTGDHYYICTFNSHCGLGQKLAINVTTASSPSPSPTPAPAPSPPIAPTPTPSESPSPTPAPTPGSPAPSPGMGSPPSPSPGPGANPPPSPGAPGTTPPSEGLTPPSPPSPSSATTLTIGGPVVGLALVAFGLMI
ncbi:hypothetical protein C2S51_034689 [Perilla frutescens var. frutescens]|nr:hypothetical protein C2S51_034689 [Perilla frutescens var. frutescens]